MSNSYRMHESNEPTGELSLQYAFALVSSLTEMIKQKVGSNVEALYALELITQAERLMESLEASQPNFKEDGTTIVILTSSYMALIDIYSLLKKGSSPSPSSIGRALSLNSRFRTVWKNAEIPGWKTVEEMECWREEFWHVFRSYENLRALSTIPWLCTADDLEFSERQRARIITACSYPDWGTGSRPRLVDFESIGNASQMAISSSVKLYSSLSEWRQFAEQIVLLDVLPKNSKPYSYHGHTHEILESRKKLRVTLQATMSQNRDQDELLHLEEYEKEHGISKEMTAFSLFAIGEGIYSRMIEEFVLCALDDTAARQLREGLRNEVTADEDELRNTHDKIVNLKKTIARKDGESKSDVKDAREQLENLRKGILFSEDVDIKDHEDLKNQMIGCIGFACVFAAVSYWLISIDWLWTASIPGLLTLVFFLSAFDKPEDPFDDETVYYMTRTKSGWIHEEGYNPRFAEGRVARFKELLR